jgi:glycosyltransferase involved in cell wall biosynthesis
MSTVSVAEPSLDNLRPGHNLSVVIPAFREADGIPLVLNALIGALPAAEIIVIDDGSADGTAAAALRTPGVTVIAHLFNRGYGSALKTGMRHATREFVAWFDADNEHRVSDLVDMLDRASATRCAAVIGQRRHSSVSPLRTWGKMLIGLLARTFSDLKGDINCGLRVFRRDVILQYISVLPNGYSASITSTMVMLERGYPVIFHPIEVNSRTGTSKVKISDGFTALMLVLRIVMLFGPLRVFVGFGSVLAIGGVIYGLTLALRYGLGVPTGAVLLVLTGILLCLFGLIADQISQMRLAAYDRTPEQWLRDERHAAADRVDASRR